MMKTERKELKTSLRLLVIGMMIGQSNNLYAKFKGAPKIEIPIQQILAQTQKKKLMILKIRKKIIIPKQLANQQISIDLKETPLLSRIKANNDFVINFMNVNQ